MGSTKRSKYTSIVCAKGHKRIISHALLTLLGCRIVIVSVIKTSSWRWLERRSLDVLALASEQVNQAQWCQDCFVGVWPAGSRVMPLYNGELRQLEFFAKYSSSYFSCHLFRQTNRCRLIHFHYLKNLQ